MRNDIKDVVQGVLAGKEDVQHYHYGILGWNGVVEVANQPGYVYVTLSDGMVTQVYNQIAPIILNFPVVVGYDTRQTNKHLLSVVACRGIPRINVNNPGNLVTREHAATHEWMLFMPDPAPARYDAPRILPKRERRKRCVAVWIG